jgi:hypothetical protein
MPYGTNCPVSSSIGSVRSRLTSSVSPGRVKCDRWLSASLLYLGLDENFDAGILVACAPRDSSREPCGTMAVQSRSEVQSFSPICRALVGTKLSENEVDIKEAGEWHPGVDKKVLHWDSYVKAGYYVRTRVVAYPQKSDSTLKFEACVGCSQ